MKLLRDTSIAIAMVVLTIVFDFINVTVREPKSLAELQADHSKMIQFLARPFDLWTVAFTLILGAWLSTTTNQRGRIVAPAVVAVVVLLFVLASIGLDTIYGGIAWKVVVPDLLAVGLIGFTVVKVSE